jgi:hypothetical protein
VEPDESPDIAAEEGFFQRSVAPVSHPPQSSSASRFTAAQAGFFDLRIAAEIVAVQLNQVEGVQEHAGGWNKGKRTDTGGVAEEMREEMMQTRLGISAVVLVLSAGVSVQTATACSKEAVAGTVDRWTTVLAENNPDTIVALYSKDAVLWGTLSPTVRSDPAGLRSYFVGAFQALPKLTVKFGEQFIRVYGDTAVNTGYYTLFYTKDGETKSIPARYSFTFVKEGNDCKIVDHHSSTVPPPPR